MSDGWPGKLLRVLIATLAWSGGRGNWLLGSIHWIFWIHPSSFTHSTAQFQVNFEKSIAFMFLSLKPSTWVNIHATSFSRVNCGVLRISVSGLIHFRYLKWFESCAESNYKVDILRCWDHYIYNRDMEDTAQECGPAPRDTNIDACDDAKFMK